MFVLHHMMTSSFGKYTLQGHCSKFSLSYVTSIMKYSHFVTIFKKKQNKKKKTAASKMVIKYINSGRSISALLYSNSQKITNTQILRVLNIGKRQFSSASARAAAGFCPLRMASDLSPLRMASHLSSLRMASLLWLLRMGNILLPLRMTGLLLLLLLFHLLQLMQPVCLLSFSDLKIRGLYQLLQITLQT